MLFLLNNFMYQPNSVQILYPFDKVKNIKSQNLKKKTNTNSYYILNIVLFITFKCYY